jgi:hypothetical protein
MAQDDEFVAQLLRNQSDDEEPRQTGPRLSEFTPEAEALYALLDRLADVIAVTQAVNGQKPKRIKPVPRPHTAFDRQRIRERQRQHLSLVARLLPDGPKTLE